MFYREAGVFKTSYAADMALFPLPQARWAVAAIAVLFIVIAPLTFGPYYLSILNLVLVAVVGALGLNILVGYTGLISIGHGAFMSVGAYTAANLVVRLDMPFWITIPAGGLMAALVGMIVGIPSLRIKGIYLAIATLAAQLIIEWTINHVEWISGGIQSSIEIPRPTVFGVELRAEWQLYLFLMFFAVSGDRRDDEPGAQPHRAGLHRDPRPGHRRRDHRHQHLPLQALRLRDFVVLRRCRRRAAKLLSWAGQLRAVPDRRIDRLSCDGDHRRARLGARLGLRRDLRHAAADCDALGCWKRSAGCIFSDADLLNIIPNMRLVMFGGLIILFLIAEPEGLYRLWRNIRNYFRVWPFSY